MCDLIRVYSGCARCEVIVLLEYVRVDRNVHLLACMMWLNHGRVRLTRLILPSLSRGTVMSAVGSVALHPTLLGLEVEDQARHLLITYRFVHDTQGADED